MPLLLLFGLAVSCVVWLRIIEGAGYKGSVRWIWLLSVATPFVSVIGMPLFIFVTWPIHKEVKALKGQIEALTGQVDLSQRQIETNIDYIRKANLKIQSLENKLIQKG